MDTHTTQMELDKESKKRELARSPLDQFERGLLTVSDLTSRLAEIDTELDEMWEVWDCFVEIRT